MSVTAQQLDLRITATIQSALACGALQPIATEQQTLDDHGIPFVVRWVSALAQKRLQSVIESGRRPDHNPFLPHDPALEVARLGETHLALLNKFPVMDRHLLVITRAYEEQTDPLSAGDLAALWSLIERLGGMGFCNGGRDAGASQHHKHLQWIPADADNPESVPVTAALRSAIPGQTLNPITALPFRHAFRRLDGLEALTGDDAGRVLQKCLAGLCDDLGIASQSAPLPPYNLLLTRSWMLLVARSRESWERMSINSLGFAGLLFVPEKSQLAAVCAAGPLNILRAVTQAHPTRGDLLRPLAER